MGNWKKAVHYAARNGIVDMIYTAVERKQQLKETYHYQPVGDDILEKQRSEEGKLKISILVPAYETKPEYMEALVESVLSQTYENWELIICDAGTSDQVRETVEKYQDHRIQYHKLKENLGISGNTNQGFQYVNGEYVALLDHDDLLTPDALYEMAKAVEQAETMEESEVTGEKYQDRVRPYLVYSDEDKCDETGTAFSCPHRKLDFNLDLFLTNNYICHFAMVRSDIIKELQLRSEYDGAQDYDLFLRIVLLIMRMNLEESTPEKLARRIHHVPKILYHWRCHEGSTADNPGSKQYAYEAGRKAVQDWHLRMGIKARVIHGKHLGYYKVKYGNHLFERRPDIGVIGGRILTKGKVTGGAMEADGTVIYDKLPRKFSGYMNRASLTQDVTALDIRCMEVRPELQERYLKALIDSLEEDDKTVSLRFCEEIRKEGYFLLYEPTFRAHS